MAANWVGRGLSKHIGHGRTNAGLSGYQASIWSISGQSIVRSETPPTQTATGRLLKLGLAVARQGRDKSYVGRVYCDSPLINISSVPGWVWIIRLFVVSIGRNSKNTSIETFCLPSCFTPSSFATKKCLTSTINIVVFVLPLSVCSETSTLGITLLTRWPHLEIHILFHSLTKTSARPLRQLSTGAFLEWKPFLSKCFSISSCCPHKVRYLLRGLRQPSSKNRLCSNIVMGFQKDVTFPKLCLRLSSAASNRNRASCQKCQHSGDVLWCAPCRAWNKYFGICSNPEQYDQCSNVFFFLVIKNLETQQTLCRFRVLGLGWRHAVQ